MIVLFLDSIDELIIPDDTWRHTILNCSTTEEEQNVLRAYQKSKSEVTFTQ